MDHGHDHSSHGSMPGMPDLAPSQPHCSMSMTFTLTWRNLCVVFSTWQLLTPLSLYISLLVLFSLAAGFEYLRMRIRYLDSRIAVLQVERGGGGGGGVMGVSHTHKTTPHRRKASLLPSHQSQTAVGIGSASASSSASASAINNNNNNDVSGGARRISRSSSAIDSSAEALLGRDGTTAVTKGILARHVPTLHIPRSLQLQRSLLYGTSVALSFFLMLVVMTYSVQLVGAVLAGAMVGHYLFSRDPPRNVALAMAEADDKGMACH